MGFEKPFSVPTTGLNPTPQPCRSNHKQSTTSYTVSTSVKLQLNCEASRFCATVVPPSQRERPLIETLRSNISCSKSYSSANSRSVNSLRAARSHNHCWWSITLETVSCQVSNIFPSSDKGLLYVLRVITCALVETVIIPLLKFLTF